MVKPKTLFVIGKWASFDPSQGLSNDQHNFVESLNATELAETNCFYVDEFLFKNDPPYDEALIQRCRDFNPDMVYITLPRGIDFHASPETLHLIRNQTGAQIAGIFHDCYARMDAERIQVYEDALDLILLGDSYTEVLNAVGGLSLIHI